MLDVLENRPLGECPHCHNDFGVTLLNGEEFIPYSNCYCEYEEEINASVNQPQEEENLRRVG